MEKDNSSKIMLITRAFLACFESKHAQGFYKWGKIYVLALLVATAFIVASWREKTADNEMRARIERKVSDLVEAIDPQMALRLTFSPDDKNTQPFEHIASIMRSYASGIPTSGIYSMAMRDGKIVFGPETYPEGHRLASPPGTIYEQPSLKALAIFTDKKPFTEGPYSDEYGTFVSAFAPLINTKDGEVIFAVGLDIEADKYQARLARIRWGVLSSFAIFASFVSLVSVVLSWLSKQNFSGLRNQLVWVILPPALAAGAILWISLQFWHLQTHTYHHLQANVRMLELWSRLGYFDEVLTFSAQWGVAGTNKEMEMRHRRFVPLIKNTLREATDTDCGAMIPRIQTIDRCYKELFQHWDRAFSLLHEGDKQGGLDVILGPEVSGLCKEVSSCLRDGAVELESEHYSTMDEHANKLHQIFASILAVLISLSMFWRRWIQAEKEAREATDLAQRELENRVGQATADLTKINRELEERDRRLTLTLNSVNEAFITCDDSGQIIAWNKAAEKIFGYTEPEAVGQQLSMIIPEKYRSQHSDGMASYISGSNTKAPGTVFEVELIRKNGQIFTVELMINPWESHGRTYFTGVARDISEGKLAKDQIRKLSRVVEQAPVTVVITDRNGRIEYINPAGLRSSGYLLGEVIGQNPSIFKSGQVADAEYAKMWTNILSGGEWRGELPNQRKNGTIVWELVQVSPIKNDIGEITHFVGIKEDISERKAAEAKLLEYQAQLDLALDAGGIGTWLRNIDSNEVIWDKRAHEIYGITDGLTQTNDSFIRRVHPEDMELVQEEIAKAQDRSRGHTFTHRLLFPDGRVRHIIVRSQVISHPLNQVVGVCMDITHFKEFEEALIKAKAAADAASQSKTQFLAAMSHELRTPLNAILGYTQILLRDTRAESKSGQALLTIMRSGEHLLNLINDVLDISKVESGRIDLLPRDIHLRDFIENIRAIFEPRCAEKKIRWTIECGEKLLDGLYADEQKLRQVLINLLGNAVKFTEKGGVHFRVFALSEKIVFEVKDTGPGIAKEDQEKIFEPFQQVGSLDRRAEGTGLGLAIVKRLVTLMGGEIEMESMPGAGTLFRVSIPAQPARSEVQSVADILNDDRPIGYEGEIKKILIVDDRKENREVLLDLLHPLGFDVLLCENGYEALNKVNTWRPHLIFMDLRMPNMNGLETTRLLRKSPAVPHVKIVAISASAFDIDQTDCTVAGCDDFIPKPQGVWLDVS